MKHDYPFVSVIMPVRNEADFIARSLGAVLQQTYPGDRMEVLVADGMSVDNTRKVVANMILRHPDIAVKIVENPAKIVSTGMNAAIQQARGDIIIRVDGHTVIAPDYVLKCVEALKASGADNVGGRMDPVGKTAFGQAVAAATSSAFGVGGARFHYSEQEEWVDTVYMGAWRRSTFYRVGLFDEEMVRNQDDELNYRLLEQGGVILLQPRIKSRYHNRSTVRSLWKQYFQYGYWKVRVMQKHPRQMSVRHFIPPVFVSSLIVGGLAAPFSRLLRRWWERVILVYMLANMGASIWTAYKKGWRHLPLLPTVFAILHISYGLGFVVGLVKFADRWSDRDSLVFQHGV